jgi:alpha-L-fucosidase
MKAEHRKELQTNVLASSLNRFLQGFKEKPDNKALLLGGFVLLAAVLVVVWWFVRQEWDKSRSALWTEVNNAGSLQKLDEVVDKNPGTMPGRVARFEKARYLLHQGLEDLAKKPREERAKTLEEKIAPAGQLYEKLAEETGDFPLLHQEALLGAARAREVQGDIDGAVKFYGELAKAQPETGFTKQAQEYLQFLDTDVTVDGKTVKNRDLVKQFYEKLKTAPPAS